MVKNIMSKMKAMLEKERREKRTAKLQRKRQKPKPYGDVYMVPGAAAHRKA
jgi:hypothetical protein